MAIDASKKQQTPSHGTEYIHIPVKVDGVKDFGNGVAELRIAARPLSREEFSLLKELFPNTMEQAHSLLAKEALFRAMDEGEYAMKQD